MPPSSIPMPAIIALIVAIVGTLTLLTMDFLPGTAVPADGSLGMPSREAIARAGATATPTFPP
jgi:hypothetical protein